MEASEYDHVAVEAAARALWEQRDVYRYDPSGEGPVFTATWSYSLASMPAQASRGSASEELIYGSRTYAW